MTLSRKARERLVVYPILLVVAALVARIVSRSIVYPGCVVPFPQLLEPNVAVTEYATEDGLTLAGAWVRSGKPGAPTVLYFHGNAESAATSLPVGAHLAARGYDVFLAEYRGYAGGPGRPSEEGLYRDARAALGVVRAAGVTDDRLVLVGRSLGTGVATELALGGVGRALVLVSPYTSIPDVGRKLVGPFARLLVADAFDTLEKVPALAVPVVVIHGVADTLIPFEHGRRVAAAARHGRLVPIEGRGHNDVEVERLVAAELAALGPR